MRTWENERFSSRIAMMTSSPPSASTLAPLLIPSLPIPPELTPLTPPQPEMVLASELAEQVPSQPASIDVGQGIAPNLSFTQLPAHDPEIVAEMIRLDPSLQSIDPALIMVGFSQGHHRSTPVGSAVNDKSSPLPPLPALPKK